MKASIISAILISSLAAAAPLKPRQNNFVNIQLETEADTFVQEAIPLGQRVSTASNKRLASGIDAEIQGVSGLSDASGVSCQAFDSTGKPLGAPFTINTNARFSNDNQPVQIAAYECQDGKEPETAENIGSDINNAGSINAGKGATASIQLEIESDTFVGRDVPIGVMVNTKGKHLQ